MISNNKYYIKKLNEGLIATYPISKYFSSLKSSIDLITNVNFVIVPNYLNETFNIDINQHAPFNDVEKINSLCNNLGYFISKFIIHIGNTSNTLNTLKYNNKTFKNDIKNNTKLILFYESNFDAEIIIPDKIYHTTNITHLRKIQNIGLTPRSSSKLQYHLDRVYFCLSLNDCENGINKLRIFDKTKTTIKDYIILEIDTQNLYDINFDNSKTLMKFREDPNSNGIYTFSNIPKDKIDILKTIYQKNKITTFDDIVFDKHNILLYKHNKILIDYKL